MNKHSLTAVLMASVFAASSVHALDVPAPSSSDPRIRVVTYKSDDVILVKVQRGVVTRILLEPGEQILIPVVGLSSNCEEVNDEWCISAIQGSNQIFVRPRDGARSNNMELHTNKRDYSFAFEVVGAGVSHGKNSRASGSAPFYRVVLDYPKPKPVEVPAVPREVLAEGILRRVDANDRPLPTVGPDHGMTALQRLQSEGMVIRNASYSKQVLPKGEDAEPTMVFDDGRFTYFEFPGAREIPAVFAYGSDGQPTRVNWHMQDSFVVVQRIARRFTLRLGDAVVGVFNEAFDFTGVDTPTATISPAVRREVKEQQQ